MSIVTLKKKTQAQYNNASVGRPNFSLNGTLRNQGYVGQTSLSRTILKTPMRGNVACGHGGCCGKFDKSRMFLSVNPIANTLNNTKVIKPSVINTSGMIETHYMWAKRPQPYSTVKPDSNQNINDQHAYVTNLAKQTVADVNKCDASGNAVSSCKKCSNTTLFPTKKTDSVQYTKPTSNYIPISQGEYLIKVHDFCVANDPKYVPTKTNGAPFAGFKAN
jgi:hypothetical protein